MKILIKKLIEKTINIYFDSNNDESSKKKYYSNCFKPILLEYKNANVDFYDKSFNLVIKSTYMNQYSSKMISKSTLNKKFEVWKL